jgi:membrane-bound lytic murein transglycosylase B
MKHLWALSSTLVLTTTLVVSGVAAGAAAPTGHRSDADRTLQLSRSTEARVAATEGDTVSQASVRGFYWQLTTSQDVQPGSLLMSQAQAAAHAKASKDSRGNRSDDQFFEISKTGSNDVPSAALRAYRHAEKVMATADPDCDISWTLLAAIGRVETNHGRFGGAQLGSDGISRPEIRGPRLDGAGPFAAIRDSDNGVLDRDKVWDRAVGQMQFLPQTWRSVERDGDGDGTKNPDDIDDSALGSAVYLCGVGGSLANSAGMARAAFRYNHSDYYVSLVLAMQAGFETGVFALPSPPPPTKATVGKAKTPKTKPTRPRDVNKTKSKTSTKGTVKKATPPKPTSTPTPKPKPTPETKPKPKPKPKPTPPPAPKLEQVSGTWNKCGGGYCLDTIPLDLSRVSVNGASMVGSTVTLKVERNAGRLVVHAVIASVAAQSSAQSSAKPSAKPSPSLAP